MQKSSPLSVLLAKDGRKQLRSNIGIGKIGQVTGRIDSEGIYFQNAEKWAWGSWSLLLI